MTWKEIGNLDHTILVEEFGLKDLNGQRLGARGRGEGRTYVRGREVTLLGGKVDGRSDGEVAALVLVEDASEDGGGVEIGNAIGLDWTDGWVRTGQRPGLGGAYRNRPS